MFYQDRELVRQRGALLVLHSRDDPYLKEEEIKTFQQEMRMAGVAWQMNYYGDAVHSFSNPATGNDKSCGAAYQKKAAERSWEAMKLLFREPFEKS